MTSTVVSGSGNSNIMNIVGQTQSTGQVVNGDFKDILSKSESSLGSNDISQNVKPSEKSEAPKDKESKNTEYNEPREVTKTSEQKVGGKEVTKEDVKAVKEAVETVADEIEEELDVTEEEILAALNSLGLSPVALLDTDVLSQVVTALTGNEDTLAITTDENLYESLNSVTDKATEVLNSLTADLEMDRDDFLAAVKDAEKLLPTEVKSDVMPETVSVNDTEIIEEKSDVTADSREKAVSVFDSRSERKEQVKASDEDMTEKKVDYTFESKINVTRFSKSHDQLTAKGSAVRENLLKTDMTMDFERDVDFKQESGNDFSRNLMNFAQNLIQKAVEAINETEEVPQYTAFEAENVLNQLTEGIDVNITPETSEINLRLHPESLGNVTVKVSSNNEGVLTARFTAQNESVKAIIESQALVLKETLESKGVTIEAVEVTVQSHQFERNLSDQRQRQGESEEPKKRGVRRINLDDMSETEISEDDELVREMMAQNGNTVDYSA